MSYYIHTKGNQMNINFATDTPEQLEAAGFTVKTMPAQKAPARSVLGTKSIKGKRQDQSGWARI